MSKIATEVAEADFDRFIESSGIYINIEKMGKEDRESFEEQRGRIVRAIESGALVVNEDGEPVFTPQRSGDVGPLTFHEPTGASLMAMDKKKKDEDVGKMYATMADMAGTSAKTFSQLKMADLKVCMAVATLFLG